ncbi:ANTAR domain-containing protein [Streptomyces sp. DG2A-72]|nr:ANTAR domain-containing protein [Streptomyces sp. DG2A-72]MDO0934951.1 ANTAR domain-containing protein [Streptomyces sp. DG2A-72]
MVPAAAAGDVRPAGRGGRNPGACLRRRRRQLRLRPQRGHPARGHGRCDGPWPGRRHDGDRRRRGLPARQTCRHRPVRDLRIHGPGHRRAVRARPLHHRADDASEHRNGLPQISQQMLQPGDRVLCFTDGLIEEHEAPICRDSTNTARAPASGTLTVQLGVGIDEAFVRLRAYAFTQGRRLADVVARRLRFLPDTEPGRTDEET